MKLVPADQIPPGAQRIHIGSFRTALNPRKGPCEKESLGLTIFERLMGAYEHWQNPDYSDNPAPDDLKAALLAAAQAELDDAMSLFIEETE
jgi:hypothetical protein